MSENMRPFGDSVRFRPADDLEEIPYGRRVGLYRTGMEEAVVLNRVGALLWARFKVPQTAATLVAHLADAFPAVPRDRLENDVRTYLDLLWKRGMIAPVEEPDDTGT
jgi:hypothetical protein